MLGGVDPNAIGGKRSEKGKIITRKKPIQTELVKLPEKKCPSMPITSTVPVSTFLVLAEGFAKGKGLIKK